MILTKSTVVVIILMSMVVVLVVVVVSCQYSVVVVVVVAIMGYRTYAFDETTRINNQTRCLGVYIFLQSHINFCCKIAHNLFVQIYIIFWAILPVEVCEGHKV